MITGCGVVSPLGRGVPAFFEGLTAGRSAVAPIQGFPAGDLSPRMAAEVPAASSSAGGPSGSLVDRAGGFATIAADDAVEDAGLALDQIDRLRLGISLGTTLGGMDLFESWDAGEPVPAGRLALTPYFGPAVALARRFGAAGPVATPQLACASGTYAVALGADWIERGLADVVVAGGTDLLCRFVVAGFNALRATAEHASPFDRDRRGLVLGEGAAAVILEAEAHAAARGARVQARVLGWGAAGDAVHMTAPDRDGHGAARAITAALAAGTVPASSVDFVSAHGTGTVYNDAMEARAIAAVFGPGRVPVNSIKGAVGHSLAAAGAFETVLCVASMRHGTIPPTAGLVTPDPACADLDLVYGAARRTPVRTAVSTSSGFAGANAALVLGAA